jgi:hypothetical protein
MYTFNEWAFGIFMVTIVGLGVLATNKLDTFLTSGFENRQYNAIFENQPITNDMGYWCCIDYCYACW